MPEVDEDVTSVALQRVRWSVRRLEESRCWVEDVRSRLSRDMHESFDHLVEVCMECVRQRIVCGASVDVVTGESRVCRIGKVGRRHVDAASWVELVDGGGDELELVEEEAGGVWWIGVASLVDLRDGILWHCHK